MKRYPWNLLPKLASEIEHSRREAAQADLEDLLDIMGEQSARRISAWKLRCAQIASNCLRGALRTGAPSDALLQEHLDMLDKLNAIKTERHLRKFMSRYVDQLLDHVSSSHHTNIEHAVEHIRKKIRHTLSHPRSLAEYATKLGVSVSHLSRSFSRITGRPFREEVRMARVEATCRLLTHSTMKITLIAQRMGVRDPSQFIADFRAEKSVTPGQYRRMHSRMKLPKKSL